MATNLLTNPTFTSNVTGWGTTQGTLTHQPGAGQDGNGFMRFASSAAGNSNVQSSPPLACAPGDVFSVEGYMRWATGTPKNVNVMAQFLNASNVQTGNVLGGLVLANGTWQLVNSLNAVAPALTTQVRVQLRINAAAINDAVDFDNLYFNTGSTVQRAVVPSGPTFTYWNGTTEAAATLTYWDGTSEVPITSAS